MREGMRGEMWYTVCRKISQISQTSQISPVSRSLLYLYMH